MDENGNCPSEGFGSVTLLRNGFVLKQENCGGWYFIQEKLEFLLSPRGSTIYLKRFSLAYLDRREPEAGLVVHSLTDRDYGQIGFDEVKLERLYSLIFEKDPNGKRVPEDYLNGF